MIKTFADALLSAEADALCNAESGQVSDERVNHRNGYRAHQWDTRAGTFELAIPKFRSGSYFPHWLPEHRRRAEQALISVVATACLLAAFRDRPLDAGPYTFVWVAALTQKVRESGPIINAHAPVAVGVNADGHRKILGIDVATIEDGAC